MKNRKDESVVNTEAPKEGLEAEKRNKKSVKEEKRIEEERKEKKDNELEDYSKGVQARIAKLTRKMREAERREKKPLWIMQNQQVESKRQAMEKLNLKKSMTIITQFEERLKLEWKQHKELSRAIEAGDAKHKLNAQKEIAALLLKS